MKKIAILLLAIALINTLTAQDNRIGRRKTGIDFQIAQHLGLSQWSNIGYVNEGFPKTSLTEFRGVYNYHLPYPYIGIFANMGIGIMPAPEMRSFSLDKVPMPYNNTQYYLREMLSETGNGNASVHFKLALGFFGDIPANEKLTVMPYLGIGVMSMPQRKYEMILKEQGSNMQYQTTYIWNRNNEYDDQTSLAYLTGRLILSQKVTRKSNLLLGLEYTLFLNKLEFYGKYTNTFNANIERDFLIKGNKMNMIGIFVGISFDSGSRSY